MKTTITPDLIFDIESRILNVSGNEITMSNKETLLFEILSKNLNTPINRDTILTTIWGDIDSFKARSMDVYICKLRSYLKPLKPHVSIDTLRGKGHMLKVNIEENPKINQND